MVKRKVIPIKKKKKRAVKKKHGKNLIRRKEQPYLKIQSPEYLIGKSVDKGGDTVVAHYQWQLAELLASLAKKSGGDMAFTDGVEYVFWGTRDGKPWRVMLSEPDSANHPEYLGPQKDLD